MGASLGTAHGMERILTKEKDQRRVAAVIGDSTFFHSGLTPLADLVYNGAETLTIVLDNRTTAMTGRQDHPGSGKRLSGESTPRMNVASIARGMGMKNVYEIDAYDCAQIERTLAKVARRSGPALIVNHGACVLLERTPMAGAYEVEDSLCDGCRRCLMIACPSLSLKGSGKSSKATIDAATCYGCNLCAEVCTRGAIEERKS
jgi:indolepyruvate ferredoxin oxidoreductase alpha subunit